MSWLNRLAHEIATASQTSVETEKLFEEFQSFRDSCPDPILRRSYPPDMHHFKRAMRPQAATKDVILSFLDQRYPGLHLPFAQELVVPLQKARDRRPPGLVEKVLFKERHRRGHSYWPLNNERIQNKYEGHYALLRIDSHNALRAELFSMAARDEDPTSLSMFWLCRDVLRLGDLIMNSYRFTGISVCQSTDTVVEPASISLLRVARGVDQKKRKLPLVIGGLIVGWKDDDPATLFHSRVALIKLINAGPVPKNCEEFRGFAARPEVVALLESLPRHKVVREILVWQFLKHTELEIGPLDARNALPDLGEAMVDLSAIASKAS